MNDLYLAFVAAYFVPLLFQSWRVAILGLSTQGILLSCVPALHAHQWSGQVVFECVALFCLRGLLAPWLLYQFNGLGERSFSLIGKNLFQWAGAALLLALAFILGNHLAPNSPVEAMQVGTAAGCILTGMLILANQSQRFGQAIGLLTIESGMALVELLSEHAMPFSVAIGVQVVFAGLLFTIVIFLRISPQFSSPATQLIENEGLA